jgi:hypothetical protein
LRESGAPHCGWSAARAATSRAITINALVFIAASFLRTRGIIAIPPARDKAALGKLRA